MFSGVRLAWRILRRALPGVALAFCVCGSVQGAPSPSLDMMAGQMLLVGFKGQEPEDCAAVLEDIHPRDSWRASKAFREHIAVEMARRGLIESWKLAGGVMA